MCDSFEWDKKSALRKLKSGIDMSVSFGPVTVTKTISQQHDPTKDAYRACKNCGKHTNHHSCGK